jgi:hypothetical protein
MSARPSLSNRPADPAVEAELDRLPTTPIADLRNRYRELFRAEPPKAFGPDLLRRSIAHRIQEKAYGGLRPTPRSADRTRSPGRVSGKREYSKYSAETIAYFSPRLWNFGD